MTEAVWIKLIDAIPQILMAVGSIVTAYLAYRANKQSKINEAVIKDVGASVDGKMTQLLAVTGEAEHAKGVIQGTDIEKALHDTTSPMKVELVEPAPVPVKIVEGEIK